MSRIALGYIGVHQIYQLALAAHELGELAAFFCSFTTGPWRWGRLVERIRPSSACRPLGAESIPAKLMKEFPWPLLMRQIQSVINRQKKTDYFASNNAFDRKFAGAIKSLADNVRLCVVCETCALHTLRACKKLGIKGVLECPGIPKSLLEKSVVAAAEELGFRKPTSQEVSRTDDQKLAELELADELILCSELQRNYYAQQGFSLDRLHVNPLWVDPVFANSTLPPRSSHNSDPLRVLYVGKGTLEKGFPYLLLAMQKLENAATLTVCGGIDDAVRHWMSGRFQMPNIIEWLPRSRLAEVYADHDVLAFPTLGDSFGFVALEAMHFGLPVIASNSAGVPLPDDSWRVETRSFEAIANKLVNYHEDRALLSEHGEIAKKFASTFTPEAYRARAAKYFSDALLAT